MSGAFAHTNQFYNSPDTNQIPYLQFSYQELAPTLEVKSHKRVPHFECQFQVPVVTCTSVICPMSPSSSLTIFKNSSQKSGKWFIYYYLFITKNVFMYLFELAFCFFGVYTQEWHCWVIWY